MNRTRRRYRRLVVAATALAMLGAVVPAPAMVIQVFSSITDSWTTRTRYDDRGRAIGTEYYNTRSGLVIPQGKSYVVRSLTDAWTVSGSVSTGYTSVGTLALGGGSVLSSPYVHASTLQGLGAEASGDTLSVSGAALFTDTRLDFSSGLSFGSLSMSGGQLKGGALSSLGEVSLSGVSGSLQSILAPTLTLMGGSVFEPAHIRADTKVVVRGSVLGGVGEELRGGLDTADLTLDHATVRLHGVFARRIAEINSDSQLVTTWTYVGPLVQGPEVPNASFLHNGGSHRSGTLAITERASYTMTGGASSLFADHLSVGGTLSVQEGTLTAGSLSSMASSHVKFGRDANVTVSDLWSNGDIDIYQRAQVKAGRLHVQAGSVLTLDSERPASSEPALWVTSELMLNGSFAHKAGSVRAGKLSMSAWEGPAAVYTLFGGTLEVAEQMFLYPRAAFAQLAGSVKATDLYLVTREAITEPAYSLQGGSFEAMSTHLSGQEASGVAALAITGGTAALGSVWVQDSRVLLDAADPAKAPWVTAGRVGLRGERVAALIDHRAGSFVLDNDLEVGAGGYYYLSGTGTLTLTGADAPIEVLDGGLYWQRGGTMAAAGLSVDPGGRAVLGGGSATLTDWAVAWGTLQLDGTAQLTVGGTNFGLYVGEPFVEGETSGPPQPGTGLLSMAPTFAGRVLADVVRVGSYGAGSLQHEGGILEVKQLMVLGRRDAVTDAQYTLGKLGVLKAEAVLLDNASAATSDDRWRVRFDETLGAFPARYGAFTNNAGTHLVRKSDESNLWVLRPAEGKTLTYQASGGELWVDAHTRLEGRTTMTLAASKALPAKAEFNGDLTLWDGASLAVQDAGTPLAAAGGRSNLRLYGLLRLEGGTSPRDATALQLVSSNMHVTGLGVASVATPTIAIGTMDRGLAHQSRAALRVSGQGALLFVNSPALTQIHVGAGNAGLLEISASGRVETRSPSLDGPARDLGDWRPVVVGDKARTPALLDLQAGGSLLVEGRGYHLTVASGQADLQGRFSAVVLGKPDSVPVLSKASFASSGAVTLGASTVFDVTYGASYQPKVGDLIPLVSAQRIDYGAGAWLTPYKKDAGAYTFSLGTGHASFKIQAPAATGLYPALERQTIDGVDILGVRFVEQAVLVNFVDRIPGAYGVGSYAETWFPPSMPGDFMAGENLSLNSQRQLVDTFGRALWGTSPAKAHAGSSSSLGGSVALPLFAAYDARDDRSLANTVDIRFSSSAAGSVGGSAPPLLNTEGGDIDLFNEQKSGMVFVLRANEGARTPQEYASTMLHEVGHSLGLLHTFDASVPQVMQYDTRPLSFADEPMGVTESAPRPGATYTGATQNAMVALLKNSFGWSDAELAAYGAEYGSLDSSWTDVLSRFFSKAKLSLSFEDEASGGLHKLAVLTKGGGSEGEEGWQISALLDAADGASFIGMTGTPFRLLASTSEGGGFDVEFTANAGGTSGTFGQTVTGGQLVRTDPLTGVAIVVGHYGASVSAVPEAPAWALLLAGLALAGLRARARLARSVA